MAQPVGAQRIYVEFLLPANLHPLEAHAAVDEIVARCSSLSWPEPTSCGISFAHGAHMVALLDWVLDYAKDPKPALGVLNVEYFVRTVNTGTYMS